MYVQWTSMSDIVYIHWTSILSAADVHWTSIVCPFATGLDIHKTSIIGLIWTNYGCWMDKFWTFYRQIYIILYNRSAYTWVAQKWAYFWTHSTRHVFHRGFQYGESPVHEWADARACCDHRCTSPPNQITWSCSINPRKIRA